MAWTASEEQCEARQGEVEWAEGGWEWRSEMLAIPPPSSRKKCTAGRLLDEVLPVFHSAITTI